MSEPINKEDENRESRPPESLRDARREQLLREYEQSVKEIREEKPVQEPEVKRSMPKASEYVLPGEEPDNWDELSDKEKKNEIKGDLKSGWSAWGNVLIAVVAVGLIILFKALTN
jgi:hypothetical protein